LIFPLILVSQRRSTTKTKDIILENITKHSISFLWRVREFVAQLKHAASLGLLDAVFCEQNERSMRIM